MLFTSVIGMASCTSPTPDAYFNPGDTEDALMVVNELDYIDLSDPQSTHVIEEMIAQKKPTRATVNCDPTHATCKEIRKILENHTIRYSGAPKGSLVTLEYERVVAKDCNSRYINNSNNNHNLHHSSFGCAMRANTAQMVSDKQQFVNPKLLGYMDGEKAASVYDSYLNPESSGAGGGSTDDSLVSTSSQ